jgi:hypothetical protein
MSKEKEDLINDRDPWDQFPGEAVRAFARFERYRLLGPGRSIWKLSKVENPKNAQRSGANGNLYALAIRNRWKERAEAWDLELIRRDREEFEAKRKRSKDSRIDALEGHLEALVLALNNLQPDKARFSDVTEGLTQITKALREEFGESTKASVEVTGANGAQVQFVAFMPAPIEDPDEWAKQAKKTTGK